MKFYLIRHGQTRWNIDGKVQGKTDIPLNETGFKQAEQLAGAMACRSVGTIYSSPLKRASETAGIVAKRKGLSVTLLEELREVDFGLWEGLGWEEINSRYGEDFTAWDKNPVSATPTGGESQTESRRRSRKAVELILSRTAEDTAVVAHGGILVFVTDYLLRLENERNEIIVKNASITTIEYDRKTGRGFIRSLNDTDHLAGCRTEKTNKYC